MRSSSSHCAAATLPNRSRSPESLATLACSLIRYRIRSQPTSISAYDHLTSEGAESTIGSSASRQRQDIVSPNSAEYASSFALSLSNVPVLGLLVLATLVTRTYCKAPSSAQRLILFDSLRISVSSQVTGSL